MGARATVSFQKRLIDKCASEFGCLQDKDYPFILTVNVGKDIVTERGLVDRESLARWAAYYLSMMDAWGVDIIAIPCVSVHQYYDLLSRSTAAHVIDLPGAVANRLSALGTPRVLVVGSRGVRNLQEWAPFRPMRHIEFLFPPEASQVRIDEMIVAVMNSPEMEKLKQEFVEYVEQSLDTYDAVLVACSELSVLLEESVLPNNVIDSMRVLADATLDAARVLK